MRYGYSERQPQAFGLGYYHESQQPPSPRSVVRRYELARRKRLVSILSWSMGVLALLLLVSTFIPTFDEVSFSGIIVGLVAFVLAIVINRFDRPTVAGYFLVAGVAGGAAAIIVARGYLQPHGLTSTDLRLYDFFLLPILLAGVLTQRRGPLAVGTATIIFTCVTLAVLPHDAALQKYWDGADPNTLGSVYDVFAFPIIFQVLAAVAAWLGADSVQRSLMGALRAEELALANQQIADHARTTEMHRRYLHDGIAHFQSVHTAFQRGNFETRAQVVEGELMPLAVSLNAMLEYLQHLMRERQQQERILVAARQLAMSVRSARAGTPFVSPDYTGTPFDEVIMEVVAWQQGGNPIRGVPGMLSGPSGGNSWGTVPPWPQEPSSPQSGGQLGFTPSYQPGAQGSPYSGGVGQESAEPPLLGPEEYEDPRSGLPDWLRAD